MRLWAKNYENRLFLAIFDHFRAPTIFKIMVVITKSQAGVILQKLSTSYLIFVCKYWPGKRKTSKMGHFGHRKVSQIRAFQKFQQFLLKTCSPMYLEGSGQKPASFNDYGSQKYVNLQDLRKSGTFCPPQIIRI